ncbi:SsrA-binding protein SmpB [Thermorudis peleae]|uniref:SsrA-binding protein SmpB n=1 Tax=Thermorudis peleae TaxID=1382356 RepID=UPI00068FF65E|nr:SsrA-binding protein SmpB [Thermorudis peleae]MBX6752752.1 SsrA-binding protein SmpB [Thermorudis peleae]
MAKGTTPSQRSDERVITVNRRAFHDYDIEEELEAGIQLTGSEIKSIRAGRVNLRDAYARIENGELWLIGAHISPYAQASGRFQHDPDRPRKLLVHRNELDYLRSKTEAKGYTLVPLRLAIRHGLAKVDLGIARGRKKYDKRAVIAEREAQREMERALRHRW